MNRRLWENVGSLYGIHFLNYLAPLLTVPYLTRVLGPVHWGALALAEAYANVASLVIEYGFGLSATREIAQIRVDPLARSRVLAGVLGAQVLLACGTLAVSLGAVSILPSLSPYRPLVPLAFSLAFARSMNPIWYFRGLEKLRLVASLTAAANLVAAFAVFFLVRTAADAWISLAFRSAAMMLCSGVALLVAYREVPFAFPSLQASGKALRQGRSMFFFRSAVGLYTAGNVLLIGFLATPAVVASFAGAEKISRVAASSIVPVTQAFYPRIIHLLAHDSRTATRTMLQSVWLTLGIGCGTGVALFACAPWLVRALLGPGFERSVPLVRLFASLPPLVAGSNLLGIQWMLPLRLDRQFNCIIVAAGGLNVLAAVLLVPHFQETGMTVSVVLSELAVTGAMMVVLWRRRLVPWNVVPRQVAA